jgi:hypothetical protein
VNKNKGLNCPRIINISADSEADNYRFQISKIFLVIFIVLHSLNTRDFIFSINISNIEKQPAEIINRGTKKI